MNSTSDEDKLQPVEQYTTPCPSKRIKSEQGWPDSDNTDSDSCVASRWVVAVNGVVTETSSLDPSIPTENSIVPIINIPGDQAVFTSEIGETNRTKDDIEGTTDISSKERWCVINIDANRTNGTEEVCTVGEGMTNTISMKEGHDVVVNTEAVQSDTTEDFGKIDVKSTDVGSTEGYCDALNTCEDTQCDRTEHAGAQEETISNICPTEECHNAPNVSFLVMQYDRTQEVVIQQGVTSNNASTEEQSDVVNGKKQLQATNKTKSTASPTCGKATPVGIPVKPKRRPVLKCSVCSKMFGRLRSLRVHETCHRKRKSYSSQNAQHKSRQMQVLARESSSDKIGMNSTTEATHSAGLQVGKSSSSHPPDVSSETTKVKLKACKIVLTDLFVSHTHSAVCVGTKNGSVGGDGNGVKAEVRLQKTGDVKLEEMDVEKMGGHSEEVLKYSQADVNRMLNKWKVTFQGRLKAKENEWKKKLETKDEEKNLLRDVVNSLKQSNAQLKRDVAEYERKLMEVIAEKAIKKVTEQAELARRHNQMLAAESVENRNSTTGNDTYIQSDDIDACPVTSDKDSLDKQDSDVTTDREVCSGDAAKEVLAIGEADGREESSGTPKLGTYTKEHGGDDGNVSRSKPYACPLCVESYNTLATLQFHQTLHHGGVLLHTPPPPVKPFACSYCRAAFTTKPGLMSHERFHSRRTALYNTLKLNSAKHQGTLQSSVGSKKYVAGITTPTTSWGNRERGQLHSNERRHLVGGQGSDVERPFSCSVCKETFTHLCGLTSHERIHMSPSGRLRMHSAIRRRAPTVGVFKHVCAVCQESFDAKSDLRIHELSHATKNPFSCQNCGESYVDFSSFQQHKLSCSLNKPYQCLFCSKSFLSKQGLKNHAKLHADIVTLSCDMCGESFSQKQDLHKHELIHLRDPTELINVNLM